MSYWQEKHTTPHLAAFSLEPFERKQEEVIFYGAGDMEEFYSSTWIWGLQGMVWSLDGSVARDFQEPGN